MWYDEANFYQIYPLGYCGAERENSFQEIEHRFNKIEDNIERLKELGITAVILNPIFESEKHGYDVVDYYTVDRRLGNNDDFKNLVKKFHNNGIKVVLDGVFNHVGRKFRPFLDVKEKRWDSIYKDWFNINFDGNTNYNDGFWYEGWEGHNELVKLRLDNWQVQEYLMNAIKFWIKEFNIDGLRLDVCYLLPEWFIEMIRRTVNSEKCEFFLVGEIIHGTSYAHNISDNKLDSITNYECYKGMVSAFNSYNLFEIEYSLTRLFSNLPWALYTGKHLLNFLDNHDVIRVHTALQNKDNLASLYTLLFTIPGIPCVYYGSENGIDGDKSDCDYNLRPCVDNIDKNANMDLFLHIKKLCEIRKKCKALCYGNYNKCILQNKYMVFVRSLENEEVFVVINISDDEIQLNIGDFFGDDLLQDKNIDCKNILIGKNSSMIILKR